MVDLFRQQSMVSYSLSLPSFGIVNLFHFHHSGGCEVLSHCGFNLNVHISISKVIYIYRKFHKYKKEVTKNHFYLIILFSPHLLPHQLYWIWSVYNTTLRLYWFTFPLAMYENYSLIFWTGITVKLSICYFGVSLMVLFSISFFPSESGGFFFLLLLLLLFV